MDIECQDSRLSDEGGIDRRRPRVFAFAVLIAIATALLCALMPLNAPSGPSGSAFNPANTVVTLKAPPSSRTVIKRLVQGSGPDDARIAIADHVPAVEPVGFAIPRSPAPAAAFVHVSPAESAGPPFTAAWPRGPPRA